MIYIRRFNENKDELSDVINVCKDLLLPMVDVGLEVDVYKTRDFNSSGILKARDFNSSSSILKVEIDVTPSMALSTSTNSFDLKDWSHEIGGVFDYLESEGFTLLDDKCLKKLYFSLPPQLLSRVTNYLSNEYVCPSCWSYDVFESDMVNDDDYNRRAKCDNCGNIDDIDEFFGDLYPLTMKMVKDGISNGLVINRLIASFKRVN
jgi:hypothetical protein